MTARSLARAASAAPSTRSRIAWLIRGIPPRALSGALMVAALAGCGTETVEPVLFAGAEVRLEGRPLTLDWQQQARTLVGAHNMSALAAARVYAAVSVAQHRAVEMVDEPAGGSKGAQHGRGGRSRLEARRGAVAGASARVLTWFFPNAAASIEELVEQQGDAGPGPVHPQFQRGVDVGRSMGDAMIAHVQNDGFTAPWTGTVPTGPGVWIPGSLPPAGAMLGAVTPYFLTSGSQFRPAPPPAFNSPAFLADLDEVRTRTQNITPEELAFARYWDFPAGSPTPIGYWNSTAAEYVAAHRLDERAAARVFALMHTATFDALIGCWEAKYHYWTLRPSQADPSISLAFNLPNFPSYPSGHSCSSAASARVLLHFFPGRAADLVDRVQDAGLSRILAGIHYRFDVDAGVQLGRKVAEWAISRNAI